MASLISQDDALRQLRLIEAALTPDQLADVNAKMDQASAIVADYLKYPFTEGPYVPPAGGSRRPMRRRASPAAMARQAMATAAPAPPAAIAPVPPPASSGWPIPRDDSGGFAPIPSAGPNWLEGDQPPVIGENVWLGGAGWSWSGWWGPPDPVVPPPPPPPFTIDTVPTIVKAAILLVLTSLYDGRTPDDSLLSATVVDLLDRQRDPALA